MPNPLPYFPFYIDDWCTSSDVRLMTLAERSLFHEMLIMQWRCGVVPDDLDQVLRIAGATDGVSFFMPGPRFDEPDNLGNEGLRADSWGRVRSKFDSDGNGGLVNERLSYERLKALSLIEKAKKAGVASGISRRTSVERMLNKRSSGVRTRSEHGSNDRASVSDSSSEGGTGGTPETTNGHAGDAVLFSLDDLPFDTVDADFEEWWSVYPRKKAKKAAKDAYRAKGKTRAIRIQMFAGLRAQLPRLEEKYREDPERVPHGSTWINQERWTDALDPPPQIPKSRQDLLMEAI